MSDSKKQLHRIQEKFNKFQRAPKYNLNSEELYCVCRRPDDGQLMVACDGCDEWFHFKCMNLNEKYKDLPAAVDAVMGKVSKYCSEEHGLEFMKKYVYGKLSSEGKGLMTTIFQQIYDLQSFKSLGEELPESDKADWPMSDSVKEELTEIDVELSQLEETEKNYSSKGKYLAKLKEKIKFLDETLSEEMNRDEESSSELDTESSKKSRRNKKVKKRNVNICGYERKLRLLESDWLNFTLTDEYKNMIEFTEQTVDAKKLCEDYLKLTERDRERDSIEDQSSSFKGLCLNDRKKCSRHLTWYGIIYDTLDSKLGEIGDRIHLLKEKKEALKQKELVRKWEKYTE
ncbi:hypothetical protein FOA43_001066 [Brettanomyces nanus]|uniref:Zinc finger PHD-type domain-containing protein n=1 Tax=Eeniella nana TaxID=13502 RepID=A0A875S0W2_EENNA|nr:uncharacterized protein FOA43_001066 [Brettanomyces nanus]QPG73752.1 hypothetical protein FOA43_001066 [Brettanomyces nanus]